MKIKSQLEINKRISSTLNRDNSNSPYNQKGSPNSASGLKGQDLTATIKNQTTGPSRIDFAVLDNQNENNEFNFINENVATDSNRSGKRSGRRKT